MEPLSVAVHSVSTLADFKPNQSIAVFGCGPVGILCMAVAKAFGARRIVAVDIVQSRLDFAKSYAATDVYLPPAPEPGESKMAYSKRNAALMKEKLGITDRGAKSIDLVIDASGAEVSIQTGFCVGKTGGTFVQVRTSALHLRHACAHHRCVGWNGRLGHPDSSFDAHGEGNDLQGLVPLWGTTVRHPLDLYLTIILHSAG